jgi:acyl-CoA synthetase (AMP-forming)/AMP-acid ligase II
MKRYPLENDAPLGPRSLVELLRRPVQLCPDRTAYVFLATDDAPPATITYSEMDARARAIAVSLATQGLSGQRALLVYDPGLDFIAAFFGCLYAGVTAVPIYPPDPFRLHRTLHRLESVVRDAEAKILLTTSSLQPLCQGLQSQVEFQRCLLTDQLAMTLADEWTTPELDPDHLALLQYTSGSTGTPKGVMVSHNNLLQNMLQIHARVDRHDAVTACWLPVYHDMGLIAGVLQPWQSARLSVLMSPLAFFQRPLRWLQAITDYQVTSTVAPDFGYDVCVRKTTPAERASLRLDSWKLAMNGSEPIRATTMQRFSEAFAPCGFRAEIFYPCYGLAEATLFVTGKHQSAGPRLLSVDAEALSRGEARDAHKSVRELTLVSCGRTVDRQEIRIVDPESHHTLSDNQVGEVWLRGPHIAAGYWRDQTTTEVIFRAYTSEGDGPFLRTGDLGFLRSGELFITGRKKDVLIVWGRNHFAQDIERTVENCDAACKPHGGAAFSIDDGQQERIVVVQEVLRPTKIDSDTLFRKIASAIAQEHQLAVDAITLIKPGTLPKTTSGKIQRSRCRELFQSGRLAVVKSWQTDRQRVDPEQLAQHYAPPQSPTEEILVEIWSEVLGIQPIGVHDSFFDLGGHSLLAAQVAERLGHWVPGEVGLKALFDHPTIAELAQWIDAQPLASEVADDTLQSLLNQLEGMSEQEVQQMLHGIPTPDPAAAERQSLPTRLDAKLPSLNLDPDANWGSTSARTDETSTE